MLYGEISNLGGDSKMATKPKNERAEEQRVRQAEIRKAAQKAGRLDRDHIGRMLLWLMISSAVSP